MTIEKSNGVRGERPCPRLHLKYDVAEGQLPDDPDDLNGFHLTLPNGLSARFIRVNEWVDRPHP